MKKLNISLIIFIVFVACTSFLIFGKSLPLIPNVVSGTFNKESSEYTVKGIDVSHYQGKINWEKVSSQNIKFVFIKSTQGSYFKDKTYNSNSKGALQNDLLVGAYHYYIVKDDPVLQFKNFVKNTPKESFNLPPVIDIEYGSNSQLYHAKHHDKFLKDFKKFEKLLSEYYGVSPIFYTSGQFYSRLLKNNFSNQLWVCDFGSKKLWYLGKDEFLFWQHSNRGKIKGISSYVDLNVFNGNIDELNNLSTH